ncbi:MAG: hypothetical protein LBB75_10090, partial [Oscillospiraceae bacterium]|nr:hypothetical protein [Oscillospiraceae bacterium]
MKRKLIKRPALAVCTLAVLGLAMAAMLSASPTYAATVPVSTWAQFVNELGNASTDEIVLTANITASSSPTINRSVVINGQGNTITFGGNSLTLGNVTATLRLENINIVKTSGGNNAAVYGNAINSANWRIEVCDVTSGTASGQRGLVDAEKASVFVYGTGSNLRVEGLDNINHFKVKNFEMTPGSEMYLGTQITTNGDSDPCILMEYNSNGSGNGTFILRQGAHLTVENRGASMDEGHFQGYAKGSDGIVGGIKEILFEENSTIDITVTNMGFWSMANYGGTGPTFEMKEGAVFNATTTHTEAHWCVAFCRDFNSTAYGSTTFTLSGEGTEMNLSAASERANTQGGALLMRGDGSVITVKEGAKINASSSRTQTFYMHGVGTEFKIDGGKV